MFNLRKDLFPSVYQKNLAVTSVEIFKLAASGEIPPGKPCP